jgi:hypothetical protein
MRSCSCKADDRRVEARSKIIRRRGLQDRNDPLSPFNPELTLEVTKPGFKPLEKHFHAKEQLESIAATLARKSHEE